MSVERKMMNTALEIQITEEDTKKALEFLNEAPAIPVEKILESYREVLNNYCEKFSATSYRELITRADDFEFGPTISLEILDKYSFLERHQF